MKEVTEWNGKPRWMWCWDNISTERDKRYVVCILSEEEAKENNFESRVCTYGFHYKHCAEIEEPKEKTKRPCTKKELIEMLKKQGLPLLTDNSNGISNTVKEITDTFCGVYDCGNYNYHELCETFTLLDGTELWVEE